MIGLVIGILILLQDNITWMLLVGNGQKAISGSVIVMMLIQRVQKEVI